MALKTVGVRIRVEPEVRDAFSRACARDGKLASDVLRQFMYRYAEQELRQADLFEPVPTGIS